MKANKTSKANEAANVQTTEQVAAITNEATATTDNTTATDKKAAATADKLAVSGYKARLADVSKRLTTLSGYVEFLTLAWLSRENVEIPEIGVNACALFEGLAAACGVEINAEFSPRNIVKFLCKAIKAKYPYQTADGVFVAFSNVGAKDTHQMKINGKSRSVKCSYLKAISATPAKVIATLYAAWVDKYDCKPMHSLEFSTPATDDAEAVDRYYLPTDYHRNANINVTIYEDLVPATESEVVKINDFILEKKINQAKATAAKLGIALAD